LNEGHILFDAGNCAAAAAHYLQIPNNVSTNIALGMGGMGYAIAGAIGTQLGQILPKRTMVFCGDGAFMMTGLEIHTAVDLQLPILWLVFNNNMHGMCITRQELYFSGRIEGNTYSTVDISTIAKGLGNSDQLWVASANNGEQLQAHLDDYHTHHINKPGVLELKITREEMPPFMPFLNEKTSQTHKAW
jgi:acetolactate synthase-1/2/3 large subunit